MYSYDSFLFISLIGAFISLIGANSSPANRDDLVALEKPPGIRLAYSFEPIFVL
jgi:hypothetical protein